MSQGCVKKAVPRSGMPSAPEVLVLDIVKAIALHTRISKIELHLKGCELGGLLLVTIEFVRLSREESASRKAIQQSLASTKITDLI